MQSSSNKKDINSLQEATSDRQWWTIVLRVVVASTDRQLAIDIDEGNCGWSGRSPKVVMATSGSGLRQTATGDDEDYGWQLTIHQPV